jgi:hypothetical protein
MKAQEVEYTMKCIIMTSFMEDKRWWVPTNNMGDLQV